MNTPFSNAVIDPPIHDAYADMKAELAAAKAENDRMRKALVFYGDRRTYASFVGDNDTSAIEQDNGQRARDAGEGK